MEAYIETATAAAASSVGEAANSLKDRAHRAAEAAEHVAAEAREAIRYRYGETERQFRRHPFESLAICFGSGLLLGIVSSLLLRSK